MDKKRLKAWRERIGEYLESRLSLALKPDCLNDVGRGMTFLGYRVFPDRVTLARRSRVRFRRKMAAAQSKLETGEWTEAEAARHVEPLIAFVRHGLSRGVRRRALAFV